jgi:hypothetical protein
VKDKERQRHRLERLLSRSESLAEAERARAKHGAAPPRPAGAARPRIHSQGLSAVERIWAEKLGPDR